MQPATFQLAGLTSYLSTCWLDFLPFNLLAYLPAFQLATFHVAVNVAHTGGAGVGDYALGCQSFSLPNGDVMNLTSSLPGFFPGFTGTRVWPATPQSSPVL